MSELGVGIVGLGNVARAHLETWKRVTGARPVAVCTRTPHKPTDLERRFGVPVKVYADLDKLLADKAIDVVDICTPHALHPAQAIAAAQAGKHVMVEKPIALSFADAKAVRDAIRKAKVRSCVGFEVRFSAQFQATRALIDQGLLGHVHYGEVDYFHGIGPWIGQFGWNAKRATGGSSLLTAGCHALDILLWLMDDRAVEVTSYATKSRAKAFAPYEYKTTSVTLVRFASGKLGKVASCVDALQPYYFHTHLVGSEGSLLDDKFSSRKLAGKDRGDAGPGTERWHRLGVPLMGSGDVHDHPYRPQFQAFVDAIAKQRKVPLTDFETAFETHRAIFAADRSAAEGRPVRLDDLR